VALGKIEGFRTSSGKTLFLASALARPSAGSNRQWVYQVALDISHEENILSNYRRKVLMVMVLGAVVSAGASTWIAHRGIGPIREITSAAQRITASALNERVSASAWPRELASLAAEFDRMLERLEDSFNRLSQFSADIAHELRTPINNLMGESEVALLRDRSPEDYRRILASSLEESHRLTRIIDNLLFLARAENTDLLIERTWFEAKNLIESVQGFHESLATELGLTLSSHGEAKTFADPGLFRRAVSNLVSNATKNTPPGGQIEIIVEGETGLVRITVTDTGCGIQSEHLPKLFDRFYRTEASRVNDSNGVGLGLAIVKGIMDLHQGSVTIRSEVGKGTRATLIFPQSIN
jgi:two-component system, OmpR family, heavy metal sensor histidine kinase CusS